VVQSPPRHSHHHRREDAMNSAQMKTVHSLMSDHTITMTLSPPRDPDVFPPREGGDQEAANWCTATHVFMVDVTTKADSSEVIMEQWIMMDDSGAIINSSISQHQPRH